METTVPRWSRSARLGRSAPVMVRALAWTLVAGGVLGGCSSAPRQIRHDFDVAPLDWTEADGGAVARLDVRRHGLDLEKGRWVQVAGRFGAARGAVDVALLGDGGDRDFAGIAVAHRGVGRVACLAVRQSGEYRVYRSDDPRQPVGGAGWQSRDGDRTGYRRLSFVCSAGSVAFELDGDPVGEVDLEIDAAVGAGGDERPPWSLSLLARGVSARWHRLAVVENASATPTLGSWGDSATAAALQGDVAAAVESYRRRPDEGRLFRLAATLEQGVRAGEEADAERLRVSVASQRSELLAAARRVRQERDVAALLERVAGARTEQREVLGVGDVDFAARAREAEEAGRRHEALVHWACALEVGSTDPDAADRFETLSRALGDLSYSLDVDASRASSEKLLEASFFLRRVQEAYPGVARQREGAVLAIRVDVQRARFSSEADRALRRLAVVAGEQSATASRRDEIDERRKAFDEALREARVRAELLESGNRFLGPARQSVVREFEVAGRRFPLHEDDGERLVAEESAIRELEADWERVKDTVRFEDIAAERRTVSIAAKVRVGIEYGGERLVEGHVLDAYRGLEQWRHEADAARGIRRSDWDDRGVVEAGHAVRRQVLDGFEALVSRSSLVARLSDSEKLGFLVALARGTGRGEDLDSLRWFLQQQMGLSGSLRDRVAERLAR